MHADMATAMKRLKKMGGLGALAGLFGGGKDMPTLPGGGAALPLPGAPGGGGIPANLAGLLGRRR
jgi:signal recognition particle subunit SRP54